jgi:hypothetical protein
MVNVPPALPAGAAEVEVDAVADDEDDVVGDVGGVLLLVLQAASADTARRAAQSAAVRDLRSMINPPFYAVCHC